MTGDDSRTLAVMPEHGSDVNTMLFSPVFMNSRVLKQQRCREVGLWGGVTGLRGENIAAKEIHHISLWTREEEREREISSHPGERERMHNKEGASYSSGRVTTGPCCPCVVTL